MSEARSVLAPTSSRSTRAASLGLAGVVLCLAVFSIVAAYTTRTQVDSAQKQEALLHAYQLATVALLAAEMAEVEFRLEPSLAHRDDVLIANDKIDEAVRDIATRGNLPDAERAVLILGFHERYRETSVRLFAAMAAGDQLNARLIDINEGDPLLQAMRGSITEATSQRLTEAESAFAAARSTAQWMLILVPFVFVIGFGLMFGLWRVLEGYNRTTRETYRQIEQLSRLRAEFVSTVSHEFRTPLTGIQGFSEMMRDEDLTVAQMREYAGDINTDALRLARLIADMLDLDRMESGRMTLHLEPLDLNGIVAAASAQFRLSASTHPIELDLEDGLPVIAGDPDRLRQVVTNLLSNAVKYSPAGGAVQVRTTHEAATVLLTIRDHGLGIPADQLETIFDRYSRIASKATATIQGTGLGLPIVRQIVQLYQGKVWATSEQGQGSVFHVQLPLLDPTAVPGAESHAQPRVRAA